MGRQASLFEQAILVKRTPAEEAGALGFGSNIFIQASLPHRDIEEGYWRRSNGNLSVTVRSGALYTDEGETLVGVPSGSYPRLVLAYLVTEAVRTKMRTLDLGPSLRKFMSDRLGIMPGGYATRRMQDQLIRLSLCQITAQYHGEGIMAWKNIQIADEGIFRTDTGQWEGEVMLSEPFYRGVIDHPVPLDLRVLKALKNSSLAIDLYCWLTYRVSYMSKPIEISWAQLMEQMGGQYADVREFRRKALVELRRIYQFWPQMNIETPTGRLRIGMMKPHVPRKVIVKGR